MARIERMDADLFRFYPQRSAPVRIIRVQLMRSLRRTPIAAPVYVNENRTRGFRS
jgi:hypothetical protein